MKVTRLLLLDPGLVLSQSIVRHVSLLQSSFDAQNFIVFGLSVSQSVSRLTCARSCRLSFLPRLLLLGAIVGYIVAALLTILGGIGACRCMQYFHLQWLSQRIATPRQCIGQHNRQVPASEERKYRVVGVWLVYRSLPLENYYVRT